MFIEKANSEPSDKELIQQLLKALEAYVVADDEIYGDTIGGQVRENARKAIAAAEEVLDIGSSIRYN